MSINVTVSGNPVSIKRGKMVTSDPYHTKKEFDKRRLLRLEQVRQQSKELAEDVRNKVRREKKKQMGEIEKEGKEKLKSWQNRKLLELQNQYIEALDEIGVGHKEAEELENETDKLMEQKLKNEEMAQNRGRLAETKLQVQKNKENYKKAMPIQHKKLVRDIENTRAALVSNLRNRKTCQIRPKKQRTSADINITIPDDSDFEEECTSESSDQLSRIQEEKSEHSEGFCECSECSDEKTPYDLNADKSSPAFNNVEINQNQQTKPDLPKTLSQDQSKTNAKQKAYQESIDVRRKLIEDFRNRPKDVLLDTRISDRIKRRQYMASQPDFCDDVIEPTPVPDVEEITRIREKITSRPNYFPVPPKDPLELSSDECICSKFHPSCPCKLISTAVQTEQGTKNGQNRCSCSHGNDKENMGSKPFVNQDFKAQSGGVSNQKLPKSVEKTYRRDKEVFTQISSNPKGASTEIPSKPAVKLKDVNQSSKTDTLQSTAATSGVYRVRHFDFPNRFERDLPSTSQVEKITADSVEVIPNVDSERDWQQKMKQRDKEAHLRGKRALEKEKVQRDYEEMMKKLPILQRKDHISQIGTDKPEYHMSEERLKQKEKERQNRLENAYNQAVPELRPRIVTIPSRKHVIPRSNEPFEILDGDDSRTLNVGKWDIETEPKKMFSAEEVQEIIKAFTVQKPEDRKSKLKQLLKSLKLQKEQLLNEIRSLPKDDSIIALISDLNSFSDSNEKKHRSSRHKKDKEKSERKRMREDSDISNTSSDAVLSKKQDKLKEHRKKNHETSPSKKMKKSRPKVLVLQNMSTQTTPKAGKEKSSTTSSSSDIIDQAQKHEVPQKPKSVFTNDQVKMCTKSHIPCDCNAEELQSSEEVCKIFIKLNEDEFPKVEVVTSARDTGIMSEGVDVDDVQKEKVSKSPKKEKDRKPPSKEKRVSRSPEVKKSSPKESTKRIETKSVATETDTFKKPKEPKKVVRSGERRRSPNRKRDESWKEHLSKNSVSTSSTSYLSLPEFSKPNTTASTEASKQSLYNLRKKPQQQNFDRSSTQYTPDQSTNQSTNLDERLLNYIKRLLSMSKTSVDELGVSSSDVQTPSQSVIELESNNPLAPLHNIIKMINFRAADIAKELSMSPDVTPVPPNSAATTSEGSGFKIAQQDESQHLPDKDPNGSSSNKTKESIMSQYADITDSCSKRIANLAAMIEKLREEKIQLLQSPPITQRPDLQADQRSAVAQEGPTCDPKTCDILRSEQPVTPANSDKDNSTRYFDFPPSGEKSKGTNSTASMDEEELNRRLLEIDMSLAEKLRKFREHKDEATAENGLMLRESAHVRSSPIPDSDGQLDQADQDFLHRLQRLIQESHERERRSPEPPGKTGNNDVPFVPLLLDIPKLPILEPQPDNYPVGPEKRHPPPSKGLITAKKFNGDISLVPHELSTIIEADSQLSTRISPNESKICTSPCKETNVPFSATSQGKSLRTIASGQSSILSESKSEDKLNNSPNSIDQSTSVISEKSAIKPKSFKSLEFSDSTKSLSCNEATCTSLISSKSSRKSSSSSSSDMASIEAMLRSIGMEWAIPTLHKTQEALALTSSSSSGDLSSKRKSKCKSNNSSEVSLKDFLKKQMMGKISSSSLNKSDASPASFLQEFSEISAIQASTSVDKVKQRTSTPVLSSKSTSKSKEDQDKLFTGASDISSVRNSSCDAPCSKSPKKQTFHTLAGDESSKSSIE